MRTEEKIRDDIKTGYIRLVYVFNELSVKGWTIKTDLSEVISCFDRVKMSGESKSVFISDKDNLGQSFKDHIISRTYIGLTVENATKKEVIELVEVFMRHGLAVNVLNDKYIIACIDVGDFVRMFNKALDQGGMFWVSFFDEQIANIKKSAKNYRLSEFCFMYLKSTWPETDVYSSLLLMEALGITSKQMIQLYYTNKEYKISNKKY